MAKSLLFSQSTCSYCSNTRPGPDGRHAHCPGAIRIPGTERVVVCGCCTPKYGQCTTCGNAAKDEVDPLTWYCRDRFACSTRVQGRMEANPLYKQLQQCRLEAAAKRRTDRGVQDRIRQGVASSGQIELDAFETTASGKPKRAARPKSGSCACCGEATKGGRFLPGHDARLVSALIRRIDQDDQDAWAEVDRHNWTGKRAFAVRASKRRADERQSAS